MAITSLDFFLLQWLFCLENPLVNYKKPPKPQIQAKDTTPKSRFPLQQEIPKYSESSKIPPKFELRIFEFRGGGV